MLSVIGLAGIDTAGREVVKCSQKWEAGRGEQQSKTVLAGMRMA